MKNKLFSTVLPAVVFAQATPPATPSVSLSSVSDILAILNRVVGWAFGLFFALAAVFILWAAYDYLTAGGDSKKIDSAKNKLIYAAIGIGVALIARSVVAVIQNFIA